MSAAGTGNRNCSLIFLTPCPGSASEQDLGAAVVTRWEMALREECVLWLVERARGGGGESNPVMQVISMVGKSCNMADKKCSLAI